MSKFAACPEAPPVDNFLLWYGPGGGCSRTLGGAPFLHGNTTVGMPMLYANTTSTAPFSTALPASTCTDLMVPDAGDFRLFSIFMASNTSRGSPS